jgi:hypothetical protein
MTAFATAFNDLFLGPMLARHRQEWVAGFPDESLRVDCCPDCGGDGGFEVVTGVDYRDGSPLGYLAECTTCCGKGEATFPVFPIDEFDLADMCGDTTEIAP